MGSEERPESRPPDRVASADSVVGSLYVRWTSLDSGWQAIALSSLFVLAAVLGVPIPW